MRMSDEARRRREEAARRWRPATVDLLLVDEAPPSALDRYFYFEDVSTQDSLFRYVAAGVLGAEPTRDKAPLLAELQEAGVFLLDACVDPFSDRRTELPACLPDLAARAAELRPRSAILIGARLYDIAYDVLCDSGIPVVDARLPYPGSGQQLRFATAFAEVLAGVRRG
jgi:hypothetical protein